MVCESDPALSVSLTAPVACPTEVGLRTTLMVQVLCAATVIPHVPSPPNLKGPLIAKLTTTLLDTVMWSTVKLSSVPRTIPPLALSNSVLLTNARFAG